VRTATGAAVGLGPTDRAGWVSAFLAFAFRSRCCQLITVTLSRTHGKLRPGIPAPWVRAHRDRAREGVGVGGGGGGGGVAQALPGCLISL
jgi:hypothetical protein